MEKLKARYGSLCDAIASLQDAIALHDETCKEKKAYELQLAGPSDEVAHHGDDFKKVTHLERLVMATRDSVVQRFDYSLDLLCKYLKDYLERDGIADPSLLSPRGIVRLAGKIQLISEQETEVALEMIESRNRTSHLYREEIAQIVANTANEYFQLMYAILLRTKP